MDLDLVTTFLYSGFPLSLVALGWGAVKLHERRAPKLLAEGQSDLNAGAAQEEDGRPLTIAKVAKIRRAMMAKDPVARKNRIARLETRPLDPNAQPPVRQITGLGLEEARRGEDLGLRIDPWRYPATTAMIMRDPQFATQVEALALESIRRDDQTDESKVESTENEIE
jgi:hypothetical protein